MPTSPAKSTKKTATTKAASGKTVTKRASAVAAKAGARAKAVPPAPTAPTEPAADRRTRPSADPTRDRILDAALDAFSDRGFDGASTREIAARAGVTQPLLNYHFRTKDDLWRAAADRLFGALDDALVVRLDGLRGVDEATVAKLMVREFVLFSAHHPQLHRIITQECKVDGPRMDWLVEHHIRRWYDATTARLEALVVGGRLEAVPLAHLYYLLTGAAATMFVLGPEARRLTGVDPAAPEVIEAHADAVIAMLFGP